MLRLLRCCALLGTSPARSSKGNRGARAALSGCQASPGPGFGRGFFLVVMGATPSSYITASAGTRFGRPEIVSVLLDHPAGNPGAAPTERLWLVTVVVPTSINHQGMAPQSLNIFDPGCNQRLLRSAARTAGERRHATQV